MPPRVIDVPSCRQAQACAFRTRPLRFSTSTSSLAQTPPESPKFIEIPRPVQPQQRFQIHMKGVLPVPRPIFRQRPRPQDADKASPEYLADVTPDPIRDKRVPNEPSRKAEFVSWKARQAETRRRNLRESLVELNHRKQKIDRSLTLRGKRSTQERESLLAAPEPEDQRLTNPSVLQSEKPTKHHILPDPDREARLARKRANVAKMEAMRQVERQEKLHTLYVHAGHFITTEKQLDEVVDKVFDNTRQFSSDARPGLNIWNLGYPESVNELLSKANMNPGTQKAMEVAEGSQPVMRERMKRLSEELTGGKMEGGR